MTLKRFNADLHIHTCLSPCADLTMSPKRVVERAQAKGLDIIAITDHNSAENVQAAMTVGEKAGIFVLAGMEITSEEEVHLLALFDNMESVLSIQEEVYRNLPGENQSEIFGEQIVANEDDEVESFNLRLLIGATTIPLVGWVNRIHEAKGLAVASHVDREAFGLFGQLGFVPPGLKLDAMEWVSESIDKIMKVDSNASKYPAIRSSDAHRLTDIGRRRTMLLIGEPSIVEIDLAFRGLKGRKYMEASS